METLYKKIVEDTKTIAKEQGTFSLPSTDSHNVTTSDYASGGATLYGSKYIIGNEDENIVVTYECKDKCKTFQIRPDMNIVTVTWKKNNKTVETYTESWEDKM